MRRDGGRFKAVIGLFLVEIVSLYTIDICMNLSFSSFFFLSELQAALCVHRDPAPTAKHGEGLLETGAGLPLHVHRDAQ